MDSAPAQLYHAPNEPWLEASRIVPCSVPMFWTIFVMVLVVMDSYSHIYVGTHYFISILYEQHLCHMLIPYGIRVAPYLHDKRKEEKKRKGMKQNKKKICGGKSSFVRAWVRVQRVLHHTRFVLWFLYSTIVMNWIKGYTSKHLVWRQLFRRCKLNWGKIGCYEYVCTSEYPCKHVGNIYHGGA